MEYLKENIWTVFVPLFVLIIVSRNNFIENYYLMTYKLKKIIHPLLVYLFTSYGLTY